MLWQISTCTIHGKDMKMSYKNDKCKTLGPTWNKKLKLFNWLNSVSNIQVCLEHVIKKQETVNDNPPIVKLIHLSLHLKIFIWAYNFKVNQITRSFILHDNKPFYSKKNTIFRWLSYRHHLNWWWWLDNQQIIVYLFE